jgi:hypothetical protein
MQMLIAAIALTVACSMATADPATTTHGPAVATHGSETVTVDYAVHVGSNIFVKYGQYTNQNDITQVHVFLDCANGTYARAINEHTPGNAWQRVADGSWELKAVADSVCKAVRTAQARWVLRQPDGALGGPSRGFDTKADCESYQQNLNIPGECRTEQ